MILAAAMVAALSLKASAQARQPVDSQHARGGMRVLALICFGGVALSIYGLVVRGRLVHGAVAALPEGGAQLPTQDLS